MNTTELHTTGYTVIKGMLNATEVERLLRAVTTHVDSHRMGPIFNRNPTERLNDRRRRQIDMPKALGRSLATRLTGAVAAEGTGRKATDLVILESLPGCQIQSAHTDYIPDAALLETGDDSVPLLAVVSLEPATTLEVWPTSHRLIRRGRLTRVTRKVTRHTVELASGDVIVFRGDLVHAGSPYAARNIRIHAYLDHPTVPRPPNRTWIINEHAPLLMRAAVVE
jgi:ectoine hydroxylase-related dioxygenase (phytanoyl-CoA dioxygenase family)